VPCVLLSVLAHGEQQLSSCDTNRMIQAHLFYSFAFSQNLFIDLARGEYLDFPELLPLCIKRNISTGSIMFVGLKNLIDYLS
jgi:hypothetical protein